MKAELPNNALNWPPGDSAHVFCHPSCTIMMFASHEARQLPVASELKR